MKTVKPVAARNAKELAEALGSLQQTLLNSRFEAL
jgi:hypothetical protein